MKKSLNKLKELFTTAKNLNKKMTSPLNTKNTLKLININQP